MNTNNRLLDQLIKVYGFRQVVAKRRYENQAGVVEKCLQELSDINQSIDRLNEKKEQNTAYMRADNNSSDAQKMVGALAYQSQVSYDLERESFYLELARDDLDLQQAALKNILTEIEKFSVKIDSVTKLKLKNSRALESSDELLREDDYLQGLKVNGGSRV